MKYRLLIVGFFLAFMPFAAIAQRSRAIGPDEVVAPPPLVKILAKSKVSGEEELSRLIDVRPEIPLGPDYVLKEYENEMTQVTQMMSARLAGIAQATRSGQITPQDAEFLIQEEYQVAMMRYQVFSALHDALEENMAEAAAKDTQPATFSNVAGSVKTRVVASQGQ